MKTRVMAYATIISIIISMMVSINVSAITKNAAVNWAKEQADNRIKYDVDGIYGYQCSDFVSAYINYIIYGDPYYWKNNNHKGFTTYSARLYFNQTYPSGWQRITNYKDFVPQAGDILCFDAGPENSDGHVAIAIEGCTATTLNVIDQDGYRQGPAQYSYNLSYNTNWRTFQGVIRPKFDDTVINPPTTPQITNITSSGTNVTVSWKAVPDAEKYTVDFWNTTGSHNYYSTTGTSLTQALPYAEYGIRVCAENSAGTSAYTSFNYFLVTDIPPEKPTITDVSINGSIVTASWEAVARANSYTIDFWNTTGSHNYYDTRETNYTLSLSDGQYGIRVFAKNTAGENVSTGFYYINVVTTPTSISFDANGGGLEKTKARINYDSINEARGTNQLIIYNNGGSSTETNHYGAEVVVLSNEVINVIDYVGNADIPNGGFVLSGHGEKADWLRNNVTEGDYINYHPNTKEVWVWTENGWLTWTKKVYYGNKYGNLPVPLERDGYEFKGWFTSVDGGTQVTSETTVTVTDSQTLYAQWEYIPPHTETQVFKNGNSYNILVNKTNLETAKIIIAGYKDNRVLDMEILNNDNLQATFTGAFDTFKVMVWENLSSLKPMCEAETIPQNKWIIE